MASEVVVWFRNLFNVIELGCVEVNFHYGRYRSFKETCFMTMHHDVVTQPQEATCFSAALLFRAYAYNGCA